MFGWIVLHHLDCTNSKNVTAAGSGCAAAAAAHRFISSRQTVHDICADELGCICTGMAYSHYYRPSCVQAGLNRGKLRRLMEHLRVLDIYKKKVLKGV